MHNVDIIKVKTCDRMKVGQNEIDSFTAITIVVTVRLIKILIINQARMDLILLCIFIILFPVNKIQ